MIRRLPIDGDAPQQPVRVIRRREDDLLEQLRIYMMRTAERCQHAAWLQQLERAQMDFLVAAQGVRHCGPVPSERRWVEDDQIEAWNHFFVWLRGRLRLEVVEDIHGLERTFFRQAVQ